MKDWIPSAGENTNLFGDLQNDSVKRVDVINNKDKVVKMAIEQPKCQSNRTVIKE